MDSINWLNYHSKAERIKNAANYSYKLETNAPLKDHYPENGLRIINEIGPACRCGSILFDALFALSWEEATENQVDRISDWSFEAEGIEAFETGKKWNYIWTRDTAYSAHLGLGIVDRKRLTNSLNFKLSAVRNSLLKKDQAPTESLQIIQDTGSGGSWPISTDRVSWSLGAKALLAFLHQDEQKEFLLPAYTALKNTIDMDRLAIFDEEDGLYRGEQSFLDWREQTYPIWTAQDTLPIALSKTLSTNICHYAALATASEWANQLGIDKEKSKIYKEWAEALKESINTAFWDEHSSLYRSILLDHVIETPLKTFDLLGNSLAIILNVACEQKATKIVKNYPHTLAGAAVIHPQLPDVPIYHNRAIWPFVSAYALDAAMKVKNISAIESHIFSLIKGAAINLSNMENYECTTLSPEYMDLKNPKLSGPVVNSQRQLWSVAAYIHMVLTHFFGLHFRQNKINFELSLPSSIVNKLMSSSQQMELNGLHWCDKELNIKIHLPQNKSEKGLIKISKIILNGIQKEQYEICLIELVKKNHIEIWTEEEQVQDKGEITYNYSSPTYFAPPTPTIEKSTEISPDGLKIHFTDSRSKELKIYKNKKLWKSQRIEKELLLQGLKHGDSLTFIEFQGDNESHPSLPLIFAPLGQFYPIFATEKISRLACGIPKGAKMAKMQGDSFSSESTGTYCLELAYHNQGPINTGITAAVRKVSIYDAVLNDEIANAVLVMPHHEDLIEMKKSSPMYIKMEKGRSYRINFCDHPNMSYFAHFEKYTKRGGKEGADNFAQIFGFILTPVSE